MKTTREQRAEPMKRYTLDGVSWSCLTESDGGGLVKHADALDVKQLAKEIVREMRETERRERFAQRYEFTGADPEAAGRASAGQDASGKVRHVGDYQPTSPPAFKARRWVDADPSKITGYWQEREDGSAFYHSDRSEADMGSFWTPGYMASHPNEFKEVPIPTPAEKCGRCGFTKGDGVIHQPGFTDYFKLIPCPDCTKEPPCQPNTDRSSTSSVSSVSPSASESPSPSASGPASLESSVDAPAAVAASDLAALRERMGREVAHASVMRGNQRSTR